MPAVLPCLQSAEYIQRSCSSMVVKGHITATKTIAPFSRDISVWLNRFEKRNPIPLKEKEDAKHAEEGIIGNDGGQNDTGEDKAVEKLSCEEFSSEQNEASNLINRKSVADLFVDFLLFYGKLFDPDHQAMSAYRGGIVPLEKMFEDSDPSKSLSFSESSDNQLSSSSSSPSSSSSSSSSSISPQTSSSTITQSSPLSPYSSSSTSFPSSSSSFTTLPASTSIRKLFFIEDPLHPTKNAAHATKKVDLVMEKLHNAALMIEKGFPFFDLFPQTREKLS
ncbi:uncharacterized protein MONOS_2897 [Monocercomonoides exilis]|uniref:uncharacterized protein n=1 Tax=Monocercomonoides exilis TaxID=2049356 RepID=UPI00355988E6|nr:hypothetical protein MONOS_2897 [Monocercomonoides exilis]|eukprot:MONOS_2897.1-p1 / transcript=MONOS_2897.1 / gene=MONOS_2897 / organism=Monocercomonoides_exilis_PA203 / gene_product=unspecified product / transcript_product=unspecified product / location=Mono_scaffold00063:58533-59460(+) / protein_length=278 / sequence_SO=supercontig / SO=protein_coding / is_pseudo=false